jgi:hypothetical protein
VRELVETGQANTLGLMFKESSEQLEPEFDSFLSLMMDGHLPGFHPKPKNPASKKCSGQQHASSFNPRSLPPDINIDAIRENFELFSACSEQEIAVRLMRGELGLGDLVLGNIRDALQLSDTYTYTATDSEPVSIRLDPLHSILRAAQVADEDSEVDSMMSKENTGALDPAVGDSADELQPSTIVQEIGDGNASEVGSVEESVCQGV